MSDTSYNPGFAPYARWSVEQAPVPATTHNLPATIAASGSVQSSLIVTEGFTLISAGVTSTQAGTMSIQRYLDAGGTVPQGTAISVNLTANTAANLDVLDGKPFASFMLTVTNSNGSNAATLSNFALLLQTSASNAPNTGGANNTVAVSNFPTTQPVSGSVSVSNFPATQAISASALPLPTGAAQDGTDATGVTAPTGGSGIRGWLSGIYSKLIGQIRIIVSDPSSGNGALVTAFHNADNQSLGTAYGIMTGGVDQLLNGSGNLDRKRAVAGDGMAATGLAAEVPMLWNGTGYDRAPGSATNGMKVQVGNFPSSQTVSGSVSVSNFPATQPVSGSISVSNLPASQPVTGTFWQTTQPVSLTGNTTTDGSTTLTTGGTAQNLFGGTTPANGFSICNPDPTNDLWVSDSTTALANGMGSIRIAANGGYYTTEAGQKPLGAISIVGTVTGQKITARRW